MAQPHEKIYRGKKEMMINNFLGGIAWGLGATVGLAIILAISSFFLRNADVVPVVGEFISDIYEYVLQKQPPIVQ